MPDALFLGALGVLSTVIGALWKINQTNVKNNNNRAERIEKKNDKNEIDLREQARAIGVLQGEIGLAKKVMPKLDEMHADFLNAFPRTPHE